MFWVQFTDRNLVWRYSDSRNSSCVSEGQSINTDCKQERKHRCSELITSFLGLMCLDKTWGLVTDCWCLTSWDWNTFADTNSIRNINSLLKQLSADPAWINCRRHQNQALLHVTKGRLVPLKLYFLFSLSPCLISLPQWEAKACAINGKWDVLKSATCQRSCIYCNIVLHGIALAG